MTISVQCPQCGQGYRLRDELAGKKAKCRCGQTLTIPEAEPAIEPLATLLDEADVLAPPVAEPLAPPGAHHPRPSAAFGAAWSKKGARRKGKNPALLLALVGGGVVGLLLVGLVIYLLTSSGPTGAPARAATGSVPMEPPPGAPPARWPTPEAVFKTYHDAIVAKDWGAVFDSLTPRAGRELVGMAAVISTNLADGRPDIRTLLDQHGLGAAKSTAMDLMMAGKIDEAMAAMRSEGNEMADRVNDPRQFFIQAMGLLDAPPVANQSPVAAMIARPWAAIWQMHGSVELQGVVMDGDEATGRATARVGGAAIPCTARFKRIDGEWRVDDVDLQRSKSV
ncbi:MAG: hypothetical protein JW809_11610 [Pirellulales bacterium]|nr:hypothetical protein [Pirellulales bacterium]